MADTKIFLEEADIPKAWYNITPDLPVPLPPVIHPGTKQPIGSDDLDPIFPMDIILQEVSQERYIEIPEEVREVYKLWRPTPLYRAHRLEKALDTPARIFYKYEGVSPAGSHKPNIAVPSAYYNKAAGTRRRCSSIRTCWHAGMLACEQGVQMQPYSGEFRRMVLWQMAFCPRTWRKQESAGNLGFLPGIQGGVPLSLKRYEGGVGGKNAYAKLFKQVVRNFSCEAPSGAKGLLR